MKKVIAILSVILASSFGSHAQSESYKAFKVHFSPFSAYAMPSYSKGYGTGLSFSIEPAYNVNDNVAVGLRYEVAAFGSGTESSGSVGAVGSYVLTGDYSFGEGKNRAFAGLGLGLFSGASVSFSNTSATEVVGGSGFGAVPRVGYQLSHFRLAAEYNVAPKNMSYFNLKAAITFGGGEK